MSNKDLALESLNNHSYKNAEVYARLAMADAIEALGSKITPAEEPVELPGSQPTEDDPITAAIHALMAAAQSLNWLADRVGHTVRRADQTHAMVRAKASRQAARSLQELMQGEK